MAEAGPDGAPAAGVAASRRRRRFLFPLYGLVVAAAALEAGARWLTRDTPGGPVLRGVALLPYELVPEKRRRVLALDPADPAAMPYEIPDPELGWTIRPGGRTSQKEAHGEVVYAANSLGLRSAPREVPAEKAPGTTRILVVGDSFAHGDEVGFEDSWTARLEAGLGAGWEVWNGGVPGYGTDQALLRMRKLLPAVRPDVVVLTVYRQNLTRNLTFFRSLHHPATGLPWSKPRFVLEGDGLRLLNHPAVRPWDVAGTLESYASSPLAAHDRFWRSELYEDKLVYASRLVRWVISARAEAASRRLQEGMIAAGGEGVVLGAAICARFVEEVREASARPLVVILPDNRDLASYGPDRAPLIRPFLEELRRRDVPFHDTGPGVRAALLPGEPPEAFYVGGIHHPNPRGCAAIAATFTTSPFNTVPGTLFKTPR